MMDLANFRTLLDTYGSHLADWPDRQRQQAVELLACSEPAKRAHREASVLDAALRDAAPEVSQARLLKLVDRAMAAAPPRQAARGMPFALAGIFRMQPDFARAGLMAAFALACFVTGFVISTDVQTRASVDLSGLPLGHQTVIRIGLE